MNKEDYEVVKNLIETRIARQSKKIEALESQFKQLTDILCSEEYGSIISELEKFKKMLEGTTEYYDERTLTHFISDIEDWMESHKTEGVDTGDCWYIEVSELEGFLINREKQMMRYNKTKMKEQLEGKQ